jgi:hypothetical protein
MAVVGLHPVELVFHPLNGPPAIAAGLFFGWPACMLGAEGGWLLFFLNL